LPNSDSDWKAGRLRKNLIKNFFKNNVLRLWKAEETAFQLFVKLSKLMY
jgi:hypothetical protein